MYRRTVQMSVGGSSKKLTVKYGMLEDSGKE
jgi:hypothetical protein